MDIEKAHNEALARLRTAICKDVTAHKKQMRAVARASFASIMPPRNYGVTIHNRDEFYSLVNWLNKKVGKGGQYWTVTSRVLKYIDPSKKSYSPPKICNWTIFASWVDVSDAPVPMGDPVIE